MQTIWMGLSFDNIDNPTTSFISYGTIEGNKVESFNDASMSPKELAYVETLVLRFIEVLRNQKAELTIVGEE